MHNRYPIPHRGRSRRRGFARTSRRRCSRVTVVLSRTVRAVNYHHRTGSTRIDFRGTELMPQARGEASVESQMGSTKINARMDLFLPPASRAPSS